jgi:predicted esterase
MIKRIMKKLAVFSSILMVTFFLIGCQSLWYLFLSCVVDIAPDRFTFEEANTQLSIPVFTSHSLENTNKDIKRLIVIIHGAGLNAEKSFSTGNRIVEELEESKDQSMVIAPQFLEGIKQEEKGLLFWGRQWRSGGMSLSEGLNEELPSVSSHGVLDKLIRFVSERNPEINQVIVLGHSAGGQFVSRYAAINNYHEDLKKQGISVYYVVANPSSYLYLDSSL